MKNQVKTISEGNIFTHALGSVIKAMLITALALLILTLFMYYGNVSDSVSGACCTVATFMSVFCAGFMTARRKRCAGVLSGAVAGVMYVLIMLLSGGLIAGNFAITSETVKMLVISVFGSIVGGILGVNIKKRK